MRHPPGPARIARSGTPGSSPAVVARGCRRRPRHVRGMPPRRRPRSGAVETSSGRPRNATPSGPATGPRRHRVAQRNSRLRPPPSVACGGHGLSPGHPYVGYPGVLDTVYPPLLLRVWHLAESLHPTLRIGFTDPLGPVQLVGDAVMPVAVVRAGDDCVHRAGRRDDTRAVCGDTDVKIVLPEQEMSYLEAAVVPHVRPGVPREIFGVLQRILGD